MGSEGGSEGQIREVWLCGYGRGVWTGRREGCEGAEVYRRGNVAERAVRERDGRGQMREVWWAGIKKACNLKNNIVKKIQVPLWRHLAGGIPPAGV